MIFAFDRWNLCFCRTDQEWRHEDGSEMMLDYLVKDNDIHIAEEDLVFIKALIAGDPKRCRYAFYLCVATGSNHLISTYPSQPEKLFLFEIVSNNRNGIDVDKYVSESSLNLLLNISCSFVDSITFPEIPMQLAKRETCLSLGR
jgi:hypothetical protein